MLQIGHYATLEVVKEVDFGLYLDGGPYGEILLPSRYVPKDIKVGEDLTVFIYRDSEERLIATTEQPLATAGSVAYLEVKEVTDHGAFLDWGLPKDLFVPFREQLEKMKAGKSYLVYVYLDPESERLLASSRLRRFLKSTAPELKEGTAVNLMIAEKLPEAYLAVVDHRYLGRLYENEIFQPISIGDQLQGYIKKIREDGKIDLSLTPQGYRQHIPGAAEEVLKALEANEGFLPLTDKSSPEVIYQQLKMSKKAFKKAVGMLYKRQLIQIEERGLRLLRP